MIRPTLSQTNPSPAGTATRYRDRIFDDKKHDPYQSKGKYKEPTVCTHCNAVFHRGRWAWNDTPQGAHKARCPACLRAADKLPAGSVTLPRSFFNTHPDEMLALIRHVAAHEREEHPLHRIMEIVDAPEGIVVTTTDIHLPQRIAEALKRAYRGDFNIHYGHDEYTVRVEWQH